MMTTLFFAPLEGITDSIYRYYILTTFPNWDYTTTDFLRLPSEQNITKKMVLKHIGGEIFSQQQLLQRTILQILFSERSHLEQAVKTITDLGLTQLDLNLGCPSKKVNTHGGGAFLLQDLQAIKKLVSIARKSFPGKLSAKIRTGYHHSNKLPQLIHILREEGIDLVTIHGRTRNQLYSGHADWPLMDKMAQEFPSLPIVGNGDIANADDIKRIVSKNLFKGVMVGRGAIANPWMAQEYVTQKKSKKNIHLFFNDLKSLYQQQDLKNEALLKRFKSLASYMIDDRSILRTNCLEDFFLKLSSLPKR